MALQVPARIGTPVFARSGGSTSTLTPVATGLPKHQGNLSLRWVLWSAGVSTGAVPVCTAPVDFNLVGSVLNVSGTSTKSAIACFYKYADGGEVEEPFTFTNLTNVKSGVTIMADEWQGLTGVPQFSTKASASALVSSGTLTCGKITTTQAGSQIFGACGLTGSAPTGSPGNTWSVVTSDQVDPFTNGLALSTGLAASTTSGLQAAAVADSWTTNAALQASMLISFAFSIAPILEPLGWGIPLN